MLQQARAKACQPACVGLNSKTASDMLGQRRTGLSQVGQGRKASGKWEPLTCCNISHGDYIHCLTWAAQSWALPCPALPHI